MTEDQPDPGRVVAAFLFAGGVAPLPFTIYVALQAEAPDVATLVVVAVLGIPVAMLHVFLLAFPAWLVVRRHWRVGWLNSTLCGLVIGTVPGALLGSDPAALAGLAACGTFGGFVFWLILRPPRSRARSAGLRRTFE